MTTITRPQAPSDSLDDLEGDIRHVSTLIRTTHDVLIETPMPEDESVAKVMQQVLDLLWIARDMGEQLTATASACHHKVMSERKQSPLKVAS